MIGVELVKLPRRPRTWISVVLTWVLLLGPSQAAAVGGGVAGPGGARRKLRWMIGPQMFRAARIFRVKRWLRDG